MPEPTTLTDSLIRDRLRKLINRCPDIAEFAVIAGLQYRLKWHHVSTNRIAKALRMLGFVPVGKLRTANRKVWARCS